MHMCTKVQYGHKDKKNDTFEMLIL